MAVGSDPIRRSKHGGYPANGRESTRAHNPHQTDTSELVHETRKAIKRMRALARLLRHELGGHEFKRVNSSLRDAGQRLAGARDAQVRLATLQSLTHRHPDMLELAGVRLLGERLQRERAHAGEPTDNGEVLQDIAAMRDQLAQWNLVEHDFQAVAPGLQRIYREGRHRYANVEHERGESAQNLHDWRKRVKSLYYALDMLGGKRTQGMRTATRRANRLGELLGEDHDLWMLRAYVEDHSAALGEDSGASQALCARIERRRKRLRKRALRLGGRLYKRKPGKFTRRIGSAVSR
jgi:CHAD domain-containing protein